MIAPSVVQEIRRLLVDEELSQRKVARITGVSRGTIGQIANGRRPDYSAGNDATEWPEPSGPPQRCPSCGGMVYMPCRLCSMRRRLAGRLKGPAIAETTSEACLELDLPAEVHARYQLLRWRIALQPREETSTRNP
jgi:hypothetical protein